MNSSFSIFLRDLDILPSTAAVVAAKASVVSSNFWKLLSFTTFLAPSTV